MARQAQGGVLHMTISSSAIKGPGGQDMQDSRPVILLGRGGGGTRLLSEFVQGQGVFLGTEINKSFDSVEWVDTVYAIAIEVMSADVGPDAARRAGYIARLQQTAADVLGRAGKVETGFWGWKLPETTLICDLAKEAFPQAQFLHLVRHPVRACLRRTHMTSRMNNPMGAAALPAAYVHLGRDPALIATDSTHVHNAYSWRHQADLMVWTFGDDPALHTVRFEDTLDHPEQTATALSRFLHRAAPGDAPTLAVDPDRASASEINADEAHQVWDICGARAETFGYTLAEVLN